MAITFNHNDKFYVNGSNVGIGTSTPDTLLHIESTSSASSPIFTIENDNDVKLKLGSVRSAAGTAPDTTFIAYDGDLRFIADADSTTEVVRIDSSGNVGIGKTDPSAPLHINGGSTNQVVKIQATTAPYVRFKEGGTDVGFIQFGTDTYISNQKAGTLNFRTNNTDKMTILSDGKVGIGTTSPAGKLHVYGDKSYFAPAGDSDSGNSSDAIVIYNPHDTAFTADALTAYNAYTSWDIGSRSTYTISSRTKQGSIYTFAGEHASAAVAINRYVQLNSNNDSPLLNWTFYQWDGAGTAATDLKVPNKVWAVQSYQSGGSDTLLILNGDGTLQLSQYGAGGFKGDATYVLGVDSSGNVVETTTAGVYFGTNTSNGTYTNQWQRVLVIDTGNFDSQGFRLRIEGTGNTSGQSIVAEIEFNFKNQNGAIRARTTVNSYGTHPVDKDDIAVYFDTTNLEATFYFKVTQNYTTPIYSIVSGRIRNYAFYSNVIGDDTALASETNDSITSNLKFQGITQDNDSGLVGIGTTNPSAKLHIDGGSVKVTGTATDQYFLEGVRTGVGTTIRIYDNANTAYIDSYNNMAFRANQNGGSGGSFRFTGGNVGIGTASPDFTLDVEKDVDTWVSRIYNTGSDANAQALLIRSDATAAHDATVLGVYADSGYKMVVKSTGNVGIGTTSPGAELEISKAGSPVFMLTNTSASQSWIQYVGSNDDFILRDSTDSRTVFRVSGGGDTYFEGGNVGIGTTNPGAKLTIVSGGKGIHVDKGSHSSTSANLSECRTNYGFAYDTLRNGSTTGFFITNVGTNTPAMQAVDSSNNAQNISIQPYGGNVGIGETDPKAKLNITGVSGGPTVPVASSSDGIVRIESSNGGVGLDIGAQGASPYSMWMQVGNTSNSSGDTYPILLNPLGGNVGIGTTDPNAKLDVVGNTRLGSGTLHVSTDQTFVTGFTYSFRDAVGIINPNGTSAAAATAVMSIGGMSNGHSLVTTGNVGIGTTSPGAKLDVSDTTTGKAAIIGNTTHNSRLQIYTAAVGKNSEIWFGDAADDDIGKIDYDHADNSLSFFTNTAEAMRITSTGNVGIGTTAPAGKLHLEGNFESGKALVIKGTYGTDTTHYIRTHGVNSEELAFYSGTAKPLAIDTSGRIKVNNAFYLPTADGSSGQVMTTNGSGTLSWSNVTSSDTLDDVTDNGNSTTNSITVGGVTSTSDNTFKGDTYFENGGDDGAGTRVGNIWYSVSTGGGAAPVGVYESAVITTVKNGTHGRSDLVFKTKNNDTANFGSANERMRITRNGLVGINETAPQAYLHIDGSSYPQLLLDGGSNTTGDIVVPDGEILQIGHWNNGTTTFTGRLWLSSSGHLGIGNNSPESLLHLGKATSGTNIISFGDASLGGPHGLDFYGDDATRTLKYSIYYRTGTGNISMETSNGTKRFEINQSGAVTFNEAFTFPTADGGAGSALITDGSGALSWNAGYKQYSPVGWTVLNNQTYTSTGANISSSSTQAQAGTTPVQRNSATEFEATKQGWYEISYSFLVKNNYTNRAMIGAYMTVSTSGGGGVVPGSHSTQYVRYSTYGEYAQIQNTFYYYTAYASTNFYLLAYLLSGSMNMTTQSINQSMISFRYINNDIT